MAATTTKVNPNNNVPSSKAAEIYREENGRIYYVCFHCGFDSDNITATLNHIDIHFITSRNHIQSDDHLIEDIKCELLDEHSHDVVDAHQLERIFIDCGTKPLLSDEHCLDSSNDLLLPDQQALSVAEENFTDMGGLFEWKCLHCCCVFKKCARLKQHLTKHNDDAVLRDVHGKSNMGKMGTIRAHYSFKCTLCSSEFYDSISSEQHLQDAHAAPPPVKCVPCCEKFLSAELLQEHMTTVHSSNEKEVTVKVLPSEADQRKEIPAEAKDKHSLCIFCDKTFVGTLEWMQHTFGHFNLKMFCCMECPTKFQRLTTFNYHMKKKHSLRLDYKFECRFCDDSVDHVNLFEFVTHAFTHHLDDGDRNNHSLDASYNYHCRFCYENFDKWHEAKSHLEMHASHELPKVLGPSFATITTGRMLSERARSGTYRSELLYNCTSCASTLCGSYDARKHWITEHGNSEHVSAKHYWITEHGAAKHEPPSPNPVHYRILSAKETPPVAEGTFKCYDCDNSFKTQIYLMRHRLMHFNVQPYSCTICSRSFSSRSSATQHMIKEHKVNPHAYRQFICNFCQAEFAEDGDFITHCFNDHLYDNFIADENLDELCKYECLYCTDITMDLHSMDQHLQSHIDEVIPEDKLFGSCPAESSINELRHKAEFVYICLHCPKKFRIPFVASKHAKLAHRAENHEIPVKIETPPKRDTHCSSCNITFLTWRSLVNHRSQLHPELFTRNPKNQQKKQNIRPYNAKKYKRKTPEGNLCNVCHLTFLNNRSMINHRTKRHPETVKTPKRPRLYSCPTCDKTFGKRSDFIHHTDSHTKNNSFACDICKKTYRLKNSLQTHMLIHSQVKNFMCEDCGKSFYTTSKLNLHKQVHENLTFQCDKCEKVFYTRNNFSKHKKTHMDNVRKKCKVCNKLFKSSVSLRIHMLLHDDTKKYNCRYCDMTFAQSSGRRGHEKTRHEIV